MKLNLKHLYRSVLMVLAMTPMAVFAGGDHGHESHDNHHATGQINTEEAIEAYKEHHLQDSHDFTFFTDGETGTHYGFSLPVILIDGGLHVFMSSKFHHGEEIVESKGNRYKLDHGKIYKVDDLGEKVSKPIDLSITKNVVGILLASLIMIWLFVGLAKSYKRGPVPTGIGRVLEPLVLYVRNEIVVPNIGEKKSKKFLPYLLTVFFYIWILNLLGMTPLAFNVTGNIAITVALTMFTFFILHFSANLDYWKHIFWMPGVPVVMKIILMPIEVLGIFTKPFSLLIRLFANISAGHVIIMSLIALIVTMKATMTTGGAFGLSFALSTFLMLIELLVAFLQAFIFTMLSALFIGMAVQEHDHH
jgi:F-type H+-transporting ATPase subunit a